ncbi:MAG: electron transfer flavoprotein subunit alpha/FixB family protein [Myxococcota bacterium]|nr:electron transfer flavoprotein subunit alpha/FixB family protein [Myxococcota bacterium]
MSVVLVMVEHDRGALVPGALEALTFGRHLACDLGLSLHGVTIGSSADALAKQLGHYGAEVIHQAHHEILCDYGPQAWGETVAQLARSIEAAVIITTGTDSGNEVIANAAARMDLPMVANCTKLLPRQGLWELVRLRWGGSLLERASLDAPVKILTLAPNRFEATLEPGAGKTESFVPTLDPCLAQTVVRRRVVESKGISLASAPVVVSGGRGVKSAAGFAPLEELADLLGGAVGCSRVATNNGWRPHSDQVGQTGTRIAPQIYIACGISGAIQHWVGAMGAKHILAINTDPEANMVHKADYAIIGDLHEIIPAIVDAVRTAQN